MRADTMYKFFRNTALITSWMLDEQHGADIPGFLSLYEHAPRNKGGSYCELVGKQHINLRELDRCGKYLFRLKNTSFVATFPNYSLKGAGVLDLNFTKDAVLIRRSEGWNALLVFVFFGMGGEAGELLERWNAGEAIDYGK